MYLVSETKALLEKLKANESLKDIEFILAYPYSYKPTRLKNVVATLSPKVLDLESISIDNEDFYGQGKIDISVYSPYSLGSPLSTNCMEKIVKCAMSTKVSSVSIGTLINDSSSECYKLTASLGLSFRYSLEEQNE